MRMNLDRKWIKENILFVSLQSEYIKTKWSEYFVKEPNIAKLNVKLAKSGFVR